MHDMRKSKRFFRLMKKLFLTILFTLVLSGGATSDEKQTYILNNLQVILLPVIVTIKLQVKAFQEEEN